VARALSDGAGRNFIPLTYKGLEIGNEVLNRMVMAWVQEQLQDQTAPRQRQLRYWWAEALVERNGSTPPEVVWANDPIVKRLKPELAASLHDEVLKLELETMLSRAKK
jgi:hypothetical protein